MLKLFSTSQTSVRSIASVMVLISALGVFVSLVRDRIFAHYLGAGDLLDLYVASFKIPDLLFIAASSFISVYGLLPMFEKKARSGEIELRKFIDTSFYFLSIFLAVGGTIFFFAMPLLGEIFFSAFSEEHLQTLIFFSRIFILQAVVLAISNFFTSILQLKRKFIMFAILPLIYNFGIIFGVLVLFPIYDMLGIVFGVLLGAVLHLCIQIPLIVSNNVLPRLIPDYISTSECLRVVLVSIPRSLTLFVHRGGELFVLGFLLVISEGAIGIYYLADNIRAVPILLIGMAYATATYPILVQQHIQENMNAFTQTIEYGLRKIFFLLFPIVAVILLFSKEIVSLLFETGAFTSADTHTLSLILAVFALGAITVSLISILVRALYALQKTYLPLLIIAPMIVIEIFVIYLLHKYGLESALINTVSTALPLTSASDILFMSMVGTVVLFEAAIVVVLGIALYICIKGSAQLSLRCLRENAVAVGGGLAVGFLIKYGFFGALDILSISGFVSACLIGGIAMGIWYGVLRYFGNEDIHLLEIHLRHILQGIWKR